MELLGAVWVQIWAQPEYKRLAISFKKMVGLARVELATLGLGNQCSIHLSYSPCSHSITSRHSFLIRTLASRELFDHEKSLKSARTLRRYLSIHGW
jgi:hypothetical protein